MATGGFMTRSGFIRTFAIIALLAIPAVAFAQFGHPFNGTYSGGWGKGQPTLLLFNTHRTGSKVGGTINSAGVTMNVTDSQFDYTDPAAWKVTLKAEGKDATGK